MYPSLNHVMLKVSMMLFFAASLRTNGQLRLPGVTMARAFSPAFSVMRTSIARRMECTQSHSTFPLRLSASSNEDDEEGAVTSFDDKDKEMKQEIFWASQRALASQMSAKADSGVRREQVGKFTKRRLALISDTIYFTVLIGSLLWLLSSNPFTPLSYFVGALSGTAYSYGLGKFVESIGGSIDDAEQGAGAGLGQARFAFLILLFVLVGKFRSQGLQEIPTILGFFTYQLGSFTQGLLEIDD